MTEHELVQSILLEFGSRPDCRLFRRNVGAARRKGGGLVRFGLPGMSDVHGILAPSGRVIEIECKTATGRLTEAQQNWLAMVTKFGGLAIVARSIDDVRRALP
jgi:hypothetical protein